MQSSNMNDLASLMEKAVKTAEGEKYMLSSLLYPFNKSL